MASALPTRTMGEALEKVMEEGDRWVFVFKKTNGYVNVVEFLAGREPAPKTDRV